MIRRLLAASLFLAAPLAFADESGEADYAADMAAAHAKDAPIASPAAQKPQAASGSDVTYASLDGKDARGYLALPATAAKGAPGVILFHEWWGLNDNIRSMARQLADQGYVALAVDFYDGKVATKPDEAEAAMSAALADPKAMEAKTFKAYQYLRKEQHANLIGSIGWCFGGAMSFEAGRSLSSKLGAVVIYYGRVSSDPSALQPLVAPVIGFFGGADGHITPESAQAFEKAMKALHRSVEIHVYPGAGHGFANPSGQSYDAKAADDAWKRTLAFLEQQLKPVKP